jgi:hypothetical protein
MAQEAYTPAATFGIGRVMGASFTALGRNFVPFITLSVICAVPNILFTVLNPDFQRVLSGNFQPVPMAERFNGAHVGLTLLGWLVSILSYSLNQSALVFGTVQDLQGRRVGFGAIVSRGFSALLPVVGAAILMTLGLMVGFVLLFVPGLILLVMWWVTIPSIVIERADIAAAFGRSRQLTAGHRWGIFGLIILAGIVWQIIVGVVAGGVGAAFGASGKIPGA